MSALPGAAPGRADIARKRARTSRNSIVMR
jgi:hypothetical protein